MNIHTVQFSHILEPRDLENLHYFLSRTAFVISHKSEKIETLLSVLWYLPVDSYIIIVTNCQESVREDLAEALKSYAAHHKKTYLIHQKDEAIARFLLDCGVHQILDTTGKVHNGKGEGMYLGTLAAYLLNDPQWVIYYDADNFVPSALLEYTLAMGRLFLSSTFTAPSRQYDTIIVEPPTSGPPLSHLHNVRICWASKPDLHGGDWRNARILGRCTRVVAPLFNSLLEGWFDIRDHSISSPNAGEQGMTMETASTLRFSSGFSVETFQLLDLFYQATARREHRESVVLQQYLSQSPHFHDKKDDDHIKDMIEESLGGFFHFETALPDNVKRQLAHTSAELDLELTPPRVYPPLQDLPLLRSEAILDRYKLFVEADRDEDMLLACEEV